MSIQSTLDHLRKNQVSRKRKRHVKVISDEDYGRLAINGISIRLPANLTPYPTQRLMMVKLIQSLKNKQNALIESPTGSGKTMALLSATCAWLHDYNERKREAKIACARHGAKKANETDAFGNSDVANSTMASEKSMYLENLDDSELVSFPGLSTQDETINEKDNSMFLPEEECTCLPTIRIYYGTRTHKQISQVVKEFGRLPFAHTGSLRHTILGSREQTCINPEVRRADDLTTACRDRIAPDGLGCIYRNNLRTKYEQPHRLRDLLRRHEAGVWDIEDLNEALKIPEVCPYFASTRTMTTDSDIIFTPFNYLVDPIIREASDVHLKNSIIILDEAHNVEDTCRDAVSFQFKESEFNTALDAMNDKLCLLKMFLTENSHRAKESTELLDALENLKKSLSDLITLTNRLFDFFRKYGMKAASESNFTLTREHNFIIEELGAHNLLFDRTSGEYKELVDEFRTMASAPPNSREPRAEEIEEVVRHYRPGAIAVVLVEKFLFFLNYFTDGNNRCYYKCNVSFQEKSSAMGSSQVASMFALNAKRQRGRMGASQFDANGFIEGTKGRKAPLRDGFDAVLNFWCLFPSVAFMEAFRECHSVVLASGTLCPIETLKTELGLQFSVQMEGSQVVPDEQIFATIVPKGPKNLPFVCTFQKMTPVFHVEMMRMIRDVCATVPKGVLVFVSSYRILNELKNAMGVENIGRDIAQSKKIFFEPNRSKELQPILDDYVYTIENGTEDGINGALMIAVFRGKVSEGIDFTDDMARCVICVGIPFPNARDELVIQKKRYNDANCRTSKILTGDEWYSTQAYRALNQALGRCLRHRNDWGAILLVDERFIDKARPSNPDSNKISKWVRNRLYCYQSYQQFIEQLGNFVQGRLEKDKLKENVKQECSSVKTETKSNNVIELDNDVDFKKDVKPPRRAKTVFDI